MKYKGTLLTSASAVSSAIGSYYQAKNEKYKLESKSSSIRHQVEMDKIQARQYEFQASSLLESAHRQIGANTMKSGQIKSSARTSMASNGIVLGVGSSQEVQATTDLIKEIDSLTINSNAVQRAEELRMKKVALEDQSNLTGLSANSLLTSSSLINSNQKAFINFSSQADNIYNTYKKERG